MQRYTVYFNATPKFFGSQASGEFQKCVCVSFCEQNTMLNSRLKSAWFCFLFLHLISPLTPIETDYGAGPRFTLGRGLKLLCNEGARFLEVDSEDIPKRCQVVLGEVSQNIYQGGREPVGLRLEVFWFWNAVTFSESLRLKIRGYSLHVDFSLQACAGASSCVISDAGSVWVHINHNRKS